MPSHDRDLAREIQSLKVQLTAITFLLARGLLASPCIERVEGISYRRDPISAFDADAPSATVLLLISKCLIHVWNVQHGGIEDSVRADKTAIGKLI